MQHAAVIAALVAADARFFFKHRDPDPGKALLEPVRRRKSNDSSAHHRDRSQRIIPSRSWPIVIHPFSRVSSRAATTGSGWTGFTIDL